MEKAAEKVSEGARGESLHDEKPDWSQPGVSQDLSLADNTHSQSRRRWFGAQGKDTVGSRRRLYEASSSGLLSTDQLENEDRPAFRSEMYGQTSTSRKMHPRAIAIPYSRLKKDRFFDWPPDPTVSRATPMTFRESVQCLPPLDAAPALAKGELSPGHSSSPDKGEVPRGLRRRLVDIKKPGDAKFMFRQADERKPQTKI
jgi:hypothetical protein